MVERRAIDILQALIGILAATAGWVEGTPYVSLGCWKYSYGTGPNDPDTLSGNYVTRIDAVRKCYEAFKSSRTIFSLMDGGKCLESTFTYYDEGGMSSSCSHEGKGGPNARSVYMILGSRQKQPFVPLGCWNNVELPSLEGKASQLDGDYRVRTDAIYKCYKAVIERGWSVFAVADGGKCRSSANAANIYEKNGIGKCLSIKDGKGGSDGSNVYFASGPLAPKSTSVPTMSQAPSSPLTPGPTPARSLSSLSPAPGVTISCGESIDIHIEGNNVIGGASSLHLSTVSGTTCSAVKKDGSFSFNIGLNDCGTTITSTEEYIVYENTIRVNNNLTKGMIQRQHEKAVSFRCRYNRKNKLNNVEFSGAITQIQYNTTKYGTFDLSIGLFKEDKFVQAVQPNDEIDVLGTVYARLSLRTSGESIKMAVQSCIATPHNTPPTNATYTHDLITNRCLADSTVGVIGEIDAREFKFKFQSFVFAKLGDTVFVHCTVVVCEEGESTQTCTNPSAPCSKKRRRSTRVGGTKYTKYAITHGPFKQTNWKRSLHLASKTRSTTGKDWRVVSAVVSGGLFVILVASVVIWRNKYSQRHEYTALKQVPPKE